jgi:transposase
MKTQTTASLPKLYIGIDVHKKSWTFHHATDLFNGSTVTQPASPSTLVDWVDKNFKDYEVTVAYESGFSGYGAARYFLQHNWKVLVLNASDIPRPDKQKVVKTDKIDCRNICKQLKHGEVKGIFVPDEQQEQFRSLFRERDHLVRGLREVKNQIKSFLYYYGFTIPEEFDNANWSKSFIQWLNEQKYQFETGTMTWQLLLSRFEFMHRNKLQLSTAIRAYARKHYKKDYYLLKSVPGIGGIVAAAVLAEVGDLRRFTRFDQLASYVGFVPGIYQSGNNSQATGMTPRSKSLLRSYIVEASWQAVRVDQALQNYYRSHVGKLPNKIIVKVGRKLLSRMHAVIRTETPYQMGVIK